MYAVPKPEFRQVELGSVALKLRAIISHHETQPQVTNWNNAVSNLTQVPRVPDCPRATVQYCSVQKIWFCCGHRCDLLC